MTLKEQLSASHCKAMYSYGLQCTTAAKQIMEEIIKDIFVRLHEEEKLHSELTLSVDARTALSFQVFETKTYYSHFGVEGNLSQEQKDILWRHVSEMAKEEGIEVTTKVKDIYVFSMTLSES